MSKHIYKLFSNYDTAHFNLEQRRNIEFPIGTKVKCRFSDYEAVVIEGSLYADQVNTTMGHMGWRSLEKSNDATDRKPE